MLITLNKPTVVSFGPQDHENHLKLVPGANQVDRKKWATWRDHEIVKSYLEDDVIVEEQSQDELKDMSDGEERETAYAYLGTLKPPHAKSIVEATIDLPLLKEWQKRETRNQIKGALKRQIDSLEAPPEFRGEGNKGVHGEVTGKGPDVIDLGMARPTQADD